MIYNQRAALASSLSSVPHASHVWLRRCIRTNYADRHSSQTALPLL